MKKRFTEEQIVKVLKRIDTGEKVKDVARELQIHEQTIFSWRNKYGGLDIDSLRELKLLKEENGRLKRLVADQALDILILKDVNSRKW